MRTDEDLFKTAQFTMLSVRGGWSWDRGYLPALRAIYDMARSDLGDRVELVARECDRRAQLPDPTGAGFAHIAERLRVVVTEPRSSWGPVEVRGVPSPSLASMAEDLVNELERISERPLDAIQMREQWRRAIILQFSPCAVLSEGSLGNDGGVDHE